MKQEVKSWLQQAQEDLDASEYNFKGGRFRLAAFMCQQAAEKVLKALLIKKAGKFPKIHDLTKLARLSDAPARIIAACAKLTPAYIASRYPDSPVNYRKGECVELLKHCREVLEWAEQNLGL
ncbi:HEPN domain-containing protein [Candidatus Woesearchaeota archaeon]|nr:HEPN domain-containing protein [Candidatus Woesearchaeota archaeon]